MKQELHVTSSAEEAGVLRSFLSRLPCECPVEGGPEASLADLAERIHVMLRQVRAMVPDSAASEPACEMLLLLFCAFWRGEQVTVSRLGSRMGLPHATAARRMSVLSNAGLIEVRQDEADRRRRFVGLSRTALDNMTSWLELVQASPSPNDG